MSKLGKNIIVDLLSYIGFVLLIGTGLVLRYVLPHGSGRLVGRGSGQAHGEKLVTTLWGMTGEQWGHVHFWVAVAVLVALALHLILHWKWITCVLSRKEKSSGASGGRAFLGLVGLFGVLGLTLLPFLTPTEQTTRNQILRETGTHQSVDTSGISSTQFHSSETESESHDVSIRGTMTLMEIQEKTGVPYQHIAAKLSLPEDVSSNERLGRLKKVYGFSIDDVRKIVEEYEP